jgi:RNA polymerase sigma-70 factor, ECF subfamily
VHSAGPWPTANAMEDGPDAERALLLAIRSGADPAALERLLQRHEESLYALCRGILGQDEDAEDAVQETFLRVLRTVSRFRGGSSVRTWMTRIAVNVCLDGKRARRPAAPLNDEALLASASLRSDAASPEAQVLQNAQISEALATLLPRHRTMLLLKEREGWNVAEIATAFRCTQRRIYHELSIAHRMLAEWRGRCEEEGK